jgi:hypothetical protein
VIGLRRTRRPSSSSKPNKQQALTTITRSMVLAFQGKVSFVGALQRRVNRTASSKELVQAERKYRLSHVISEPIARCE